MKRYSLLVVVFLLLATLPSPSFSLYDYVIPNCRAIFRDGKFNGSAFVYRGYFVTAYHCVDEDRSYDMIDSNFDDEPVKLVDYDQDLDIALLLPENAPIYSGFEKSEKLSIGNEVFLVGNSNRPFLFTHGLISGLHDYNFVSDLRSFPGDSGAPVFDQEGKLLGMVLGFYIPGSYNGYTECVGVEAIDEVVNRANGP